MASMNLNPYNLNKNNENHSQGPTKMYSNHYAGDYKIEEEDEEEKERRKAREKYLKSYGFETSNPKDVDLNKPQQPPKKNNLPLIIGIAVLGIILIIVFSLL